MFSWLKLGSLRTRLLGAFFLLSVVPLSVVGTFIYRQGEDALRARVFDQLETVARLKSQQIEEWVTDRQHDVTQPASIHVFQRQAAILRAQEGLAQGKAAYQEIRQILERLRSTGEFTEMFLLDPDRGRVLISTDPEQEGKFKSDRPYLREGRTGPFVQHVYYSLTLEKAVMAFSAPVQDLQGRLTGVLVGRVDLRFLDRIMAARAGLGRTGRTFLVNRFNYFVSESLGRGEYGWQPVFTEGVKRALAGETGTALYVNHEQRAVVGAYRWVPDLGLALIAEVEQDEAFAPIRRLWLALMAALTLVSGVAILLALAITYRISRPLTRLVEAARTIGRGDFSHRVEVTRPDEVATLASAMNRMADDLLRSRRELEAYSQTLESHVEKRTRELSQAQDQLRQAQKMEAVGRLAGGVAHDFNNLLTAIMGYSDLLMSGLAEGDPRRGDLEQIKHAADRAASLTRQLLAFSRRQVLQPRVLDLNAVVGSIEKMLQRLIGEDIDLVTVLDPALGRVKADPGQLEQILMNLAVNARDAMPQGGKLTIETTNVELDGAYAGQHVAVRPGSYVMMAVSDTGCGMDAETRSHLFEPFFTTKEVGKGTGLGLATVYGIVKQSGGSIWAYSEPGRGATFKIYLPRFEESAGAQVVVAPPAKSVGGSETILLVEDDEAVRSLAGDVLQRHGYTVLEARHGAEALVISERHAGPIALMLTDVVMPGKRGHEVAGQLAAGRPDMKVLYMSGYTDNGIVHQGVLDAGMAFLAKPFTPSALARKVREVLDAPRDG